MNIVFLAKRKPFTEDAVNLIKLHVPKAEIIFGERGDPFPEYLSSKQYDYVISYISPWAIPKPVLDNTKIAAINFHTGSPKYPGIGCTNFALYNGEKEYGITVHHMEEKVDRGNIIATEQFPIFEKDTVYSLTQRCYAYVFIAFTKIFQKMIAEQPLPKSDERWQRMPYTRKQLNDLCRLNRSMSEEEIQKRIRATEYPGMPGAYFEDEIQKEASVDA